MASTKTQPARGMRDFLPTDVRKREYVIGVIKEVYERYGFEPLETPAVENIETLLGKYGEEGNQLIFKILKRGVHESTGEADLALRYDLTVPLARVVAEYQNEFPRFLKRYQIQPVWRADRPARGRFREFYQCDVDIVGSRSMVVETELCTAAGEALTSLGFEDFTIRLNHRQALTGLLLSAGVPLEKHSVTLICLDKLDKLGPEGVEKELLERGIGSGPAEALLNFFADLTSLERAAEIATGDNYEDTRDALNTATIGRLVEAVGNSEIGAQGINELVMILAYSKASGISSRIKIDPSLARGLSYYTGAIFEISVPDLAGSLGGGGRYDNLMGMFCNREIPACGFSLGLERIMVLMSERSMFSPNLTSRFADVMIAISNEEFVPKALSIAQNLRSSDPKLSVIVYPQPSDKIHKQRAYRRAMKTALLVTVDERGQTWIENEQVSVEEIPNRVGEMLPSVIATLRKEKELVRDSSDRLKRVIENKAGDPSEGDE